MMKMLDGVGIKCIYQNSTSAHTFWAWRKNRPELAPLFFLKILPLNLA